MAQDVILVVDDEPAIREVVKNYLERDGYTVVLAEDGKQAVAKAKEHNPNLIVLDLMLPEMDGWDVCREVRRFSQTPIIMLTARGDEIDRVAGLEMGADDYMPKPFSPRELVARVKAVLRRAKPATEPRQVLRFKDLVVDYDARQVTSGDKNVSLTPKEFDLLYFLASHPGRVATREVLLQHVWGYEYFGDVRTVDSHIKTLREKLGNPTNQHIRTVWGVGYRFEASLPG